MNLPKSPNQPVYAIILAGGSGTRLWPLSRAGFPKQLLSLNHSESLLQQTARRLLKAIPPERILTVTHVEQQADVAWQLQAVNPKLKQGILGEPERRNTLPAVAWSLATIQARSPEALVGVFPADHLILKEKEFLAAFQRGLSVARSGYLATFGIRPTFPSPDYGYIRLGQSLNHTGAYHIHSFVEKPDKIKASFYLRQGNYYWNSGMFVFQSTVFQEELKRHQPEICKLRNLSSYAGLPKISVDYGIMEKTRRGVIIPIDVGWNDLGSWEVLYDISQKDKKKNVIRGDVIALDSASSLFFADRGLIASIGLKDMIVVKTDDAVLVSPRERAHEVTAVLNQLKQRGSELARTHRSVKRPWGTYTVLEEGPGHKIKRIVVDPGHSLSLQKHRHRSEHWVVIEGRAKIVHENRRFSLGPNQSTFIPQGHLHRLSNPGKKPLQIIEVQTGSYLGEDDILRLEDNYGRIES